MKYDKPEAVKLGNAVNAIQSGTEKNTAGSDSEKPFLQSDAAYEADE